MAVWLAEPRVQRPTAPTAPIVRALGAVHCRASGGTDGQPPAERPRGASHPHGDLQVVTWRAAVGRLSILTKQTVFSTHRGDAGACDCARENAAAAVSGACVLTPPWTRAHVQSKALHGLHHLWRAATYRYSSRNARLGDECDLDAHAVVALHSRRVSGELVAALTRSAVHARQIARLGGARQGTVWLGATIGAGVCVWGGGGGVDRRLRHHRHARQPAARTPPQCHSHRACP